MANSTARAHLDINDGTINTNGDSLKQVGITGANVGAAATATGLLTIQSNNALAADVGGSIAFGGRYQGNTDAANWAFIAGLKATSGTGDLGGYLQFSTRSSSGGNVTEKMRITDSGAVLINSTSNFGLSGVFAVKNASGAIGSFSCQNSATAFAFGNQSGTATYNAIYFYTNAFGTNVGSIAVNSGSTSYNTTSDYRLKENIQPMTGALAKIFALKPVTYTWKADGSEAEGFIAHELAEVCPHAVTGEKDAVDDKGNPKYQQVDVSFLVATLTAAIQEQQALITALTARIAVLENT